MAPGDNGTVQSMTGTSADQATTGKRTTFMAVKATQQSDTDTTAAEGTDVASGADAAQQASVPGGRASWRPPATQEAAGAARAWAVVLRHARRSAWLLLAARSLVAAGNLDLAAQASQRSARGVAMRN